jgi:hypothetical protein
MMIIELSIEMNAPIPKIKKMDSTCSKDSVELTRTIRMMI